ncbi:hypothetical protein CEXT_704651 [Caerostris extrusa]|uniref:Uncharacterized protein n=1 Tax=Caerostris extrusa TaxID=172846 RepID=A0AAV4SP45_CAEEX|nr:hypothetical protein CEXT_704651 [Caerostris extrusa]
MLGKSTNVLVIINPIEANLKNSRRALSYTVLARTAKMQARQVKIKTFVTKLKVMKKLKESFPQQICTCDKTRLIYMKMPYTCDADNCEFGKPIDFKASGERIWRN